MNGATLIIILILMGGAIAYTGDHIGMRVGRKRLSLLGLRPKYTSMIITIVTGTLIAAATVSVLMFVSVDVRTALFQMKEIKAELVMTKNALAQSEARLKEVSDQVGGLQAKMGELVDQISAKTREYNDLVIKYDKLKGEYTTLNSNYQSLTSDYEGLKVQYDELSGEYGTLSEKYTGLDKDFKTLQGEYQALGTSYKELDSQYKELDTRYTGLQTNYQQLEEKYSLLNNTYQELNVNYQKLNGEYQGLSAKYEKLTKDYEVLQGELALVSAERDRARKELADMEEDKKNLSRELSETEEALAAARKAQEELNRQIDGLQKEKYALEGEVSKLKTEMENVKAQAEGWRAGFEGMLKSDIVYRADEIILSCVIEGGRPIEDIREDMVAFMTRANTLAFQRGARIQGDDVNAIWWLEQDVNEAYKKLEKEIKGKAVVRLLSALNTVRGEPVHAYFQIIPDGKVFDAGEVIVKRRINGKESPEIIQNELFSMLAEVNSIAIKKGMGSDEQGTVGRVVSAVELQNAIKQIRTAQAPVEVSVVAVDETWRSGELKINFKVDYLLIK